MTIMKSFEQQHPVLIQDLRGREAHSILERNRVQLLVLWHDLPGIDYAAHPECVKSIIIPQMKMLVRQV